MPIISTIHEGEVRYLQRRSHEAVAFQSASKAMVERGVFLTTYAATASVVSHGADGQLRFPAHVGVAKEGQLCPQNGNVEEGRPLVADPYRATSPREAERGTRIRVWDTVADGEGFHLRLRVDPTFFLGISNGEPVLSRVPVVWYWGEPSAAVLRAALKAAWQRREEVVDPVAVAVGQ